MTIDWWTLALQAVNFLVLVWLLWRFLYRPVNAVITKRKQLAEQAFAEADAEKLKAQQAERKFEGAEAGIAAEHEQRLAEARAQIDAERAAALEEAGKKADELVEAARRSIAKERDAVLNEVREQVTGMAADLAAGLLRSVGPDVASTAFLDGIERELKALPKDEIERMNTDLALDDARVAIITAQPLTPKEQKEWTRRLAAALGQGPKFEFTANPDLLGGAELHLPHAEIKLTWADQLRKAQAVVRDDADTS